MISPGVGKKRELEVDQAENRRKEQLARALNVPDLTAACVLETQLFASFETRQPNLLAIVGLELPPPALSPGWDRAYAAELTRYTDSMRLSIGLVRLPGSSGGDTR